MAIRPFNENLQRNFRDQTGSPGAPKVIDDELPAQAVILMGANFDSSNAQYVRTGTFESPFLSNQTYQGASGTNSSTGITMLTVTTGKTFYVMGVSIANQSVATPGNWNLTGATNVIRGYTGAGASQVLVGSGNYPISTVPSGTAFVLGHAFGASSCAWTVWGYEQ